MSLRRPASLLVAALIAACFGDTTPSSPGEENPPPADPAVLTALSIAATPATTIFLGTSIKLTATALDQFGNPFSGASTTWSSSASAIAPVDQSGNVSGIAEGTATILATSTAGGVTVTASTPVAVSSATPVLTDIVIGIPQVTLAVAQTTQLTATFLDQYRRPFSASVTWVSSNPSIADIGAVTGFLTAHLPGTTTVTATATDGHTTVTKTVGITVTPRVTIETVVVTPASPIPLIIGHTVQLSASARDASNNPLPATITWFSTNTDLATVTATGLVTAVAVGDVFVGATASTPTAVVTGDALIKITLPFATTGNVTATVFNTFEPATVDIAKGGTVNWAFSEPSDVVFSAVAGAPANIPASIGGPVSRQFNTAGTFTYASTVHAGMTGTIIVH